MSKQLKTDKALDKNLRPLKVGEKTSPIELAEDKVRVNEKATFSKDLVIQGDLFIEGSTADIKMTDGVEIETTTTGGYVTVRANALSVYSAAYSGDGDSTDNEAILALVPSSGMDAKILLYDASAIKWTIGNDANDSNNLKIDATDTTVGAATKLTLTTDGDLKADRDIYTGRAVSFDSGLTTYIQESSDDVLSIYVGGDEMLKIDESSVGNGTVTSQGSLLIKERIGAAADVAAYGQIWVKQATPNELYFTNDAGNDIQLTSGTSAAGGGGTSYHYKMHQFYASATTDVYVPFGASTVEGSSTSTTMIDDTFWIAPFDGKLVKAYLYARTGPDETDLKLRINGTLGASVLSGGAVDADSGSTVYSFTCDQNNTFSEGDVINLYADITTAPYQVTMTTVWEID